MNNLQTNVMSIITIGSNEKEINDCLENIKQLNVPADITINYVKTEALNYYDKWSHICQKIIASEQSKYKLYVPADIRFKNKHVLEWIIQTFKNNPQCAMIGGEKNLYWCIGVLGDFIATQYDLPWRTNMFTDEVIANFSQTFEYERRGYTCNIMQFKDEFYVRNNPIRKLPENEIELFKCEYSEELSGNKQIIIPKYNYYAPMEEYFDKARKIVSDFIYKNDLENALNTINQVSGMMYNFNQFYTDDCLENQLKIIEQKLSSMLKNPNYESKPDTVLFYDGFGLDTRGLTQIYLKALGELGYKIIYITAAESKSAIPTLESIINKYDGIIECLPRTTSIQKYLIMTNFILKYRPKHAFLYIYPFDVSAILVFMHFEGIMKRYQINLTDHAFWLGRNAFDYCLEFRNYGASISYKYRKIPLDKMICQMYYPPINREYKFSGYPFVKDKNDFIIFSGGSLYKTFDEEKTYYQLVDYCLNTFAHVKFWYAGYGDDSELKKLMEKYPNRVYHTSERKDLIYVLENVDMYLNTYPMAGGLMMQYSASAGKAPFTLHHNDEANDILIDQDNLGIEFNSLNEMKNALYKYISDSNYRNELNLKVKSAVITEKKFCFELVNILENHKSNYPIKIIDIDTSQFRFEFFYRYINQHKNK